MADRIALVTANFGGIDLLKPLPSREAIDAFYYCDDAAVASSNDDARRTWTTVAVPNYPRHDFGPRLRGRYFKHQIHRLDEVMNHRWLVWADSTIRFKELRFITEKCEYLASRPPSERALVIPHPDRATVIQEFQYLQAKIESGSPYQSERYLNERMPEQIADFRRRGWSVDEPLYCGTFWIVENSDAFQRCWDDWWDQNLKFGMMDQLSLPVMLKKHALAPRLLDVKLQENAHFTVEPHVDNSPRPALARRIARRIRRAFST